MKTLEYRVDGSIATITIKSPPANALSSIIFKELKQMLADIKLENSIKAIILRGEGRFFSAGADIKEFTSFQDAADYQSLAEMGQHLFDEIEHFHIPIIAAIHGAALGGGLELAMACHIRVVSEQAKLGLPELTLGIIPGFAGTQRLPQFVGSAKAYEMILSGDPISGIEAHRLGLANQVFSEDELFSEVTKLATKIAEKSKPTINRIMQLIPYAKTEQFSKGAQAEAKAFGEIFGSDDAREGVKAFMEKRKPKFQDK